MKVPRNGREDRVRPELVRVDSLVGGNLEGEAKRQRSEGDEATLAAKVTVTGDDRQTDGRTTQTLTLTLETVEEETSRLPRLVWVTWVRLLDPWGNAQPRLARWRLVAANGGQSASRWPLRLGLFGHGRIGAVASRLCILPQVCASKLDWERVKDSSNEYNGNS
ncbi:predicted protein [Histoplasma mississippiense (nom. inval.)]|uniref:predicted protein n=1 Tax=Ajellomyces capsulatus (strain NAm1 / WU24) TaxID=2059318 RepID=UPI000157B2FB|nr:predicted protein [Histoplasma mississippiense (nom. inval.)]EDN02177.1 predicted protein [Histoplasma mississippiense (nom. inval.)]